MFSEQLETARPAPVSALEKARILAALPEEGEIGNLALALRQKVATLSGVLAAAQRESVYGVKIISVPQAAVVLHARAILVISEHALTLLTAVELQAVVAHEIGHEYIWAEYEQAKTAADRHRLQELELVCDAMVSPPFIVST
jgi:predicted Zn-dependent protease